MRLIRPVTITPAMLTSSDVPENDYTAWSSATAYTIGNRCLYNHKNYECLVANTNYQPDANTGGTAPKWLDLGYCNRWKMFDQVVGTQTTQANSITITVAPGLIDSIAFMDVAASTIEITMTDPGEGIVYTETLNMSMGGHVSDWYTYFVDPIIMDDAAVLLGIPPYGSATITITISNPSASAAIGTLVFGTQADLGGTQYDPTIGINDYSQKTTDSFGNITITPRAYSKRLSCTLILNNTSVDWLQRTLASYRTTPLVWVGDDDGLFSSMLVYGFYKSFEITIPGPVISTCSLEIEGLV